MYRRPLIGRVTRYPVASVIALAVSEIGFAVLDDLGVGTTGATAGMSHRVHDLTLGRDVRVALVTLAYLLTHAVLFVAKFPVYELVIFAERHPPEPPAADGLPDLPAARRSRHQVVSMTRANRAP